MTDSKASLPQQFLDELQTDFPNYDFSCAFEGKNILTFRLMPGNTIGEIEKLIPKVQMIPNLKNAYAIFLPSSNERKILSGLSSEDKIYFQSFPSMLVSHFASVQNNDLVLDICASPGSKASMIGLELNSSKNLYVNEPSVQRLRRLKANLDNFGLSDVHYYQNLSSKIHEELYNFFDKVVVDVPCSMEGRFDLRDKNSICQWSFKKTKSLAKLSSQILESAVRYCKVGGRIIFSTCTLNVRENEDIIAEFITKYKQNLKILQLNEDQIPLIETKFGKISPKIGKRREYKSELQRQIANNSLLILPDENFAGFFISVLQKL